MQQALNIAVVGMGGVFPGAANTTAFWRRILDSRSAIADAPASRWIAPPEAVVRPGPEPDKALGRRCALVGDLHFDPQGFALPADALKDLDPLYHLVLQAGREAVAGGCLKGVDARRTGTILAAIALPTDGASRLAHHLFAQAIAAQIDPDGLVAPRLPTREACRAARVTGFPAAVLAAALGLGGGGYTLDAACASSLYAVRLACDALSAGRLDAVLAGGVSRPDCLYTQVGFSQLRALSPSGRCAPFDAEADGLVVGEGAGILVLKRLNDALTDGDTIYAVIRAVGLSNDMRGNLLAPDVQGQVRAMRNAYRQARWAPGRVDLIECHGAGTPVGDRVEIESLHQLIAEASPFTTSCAIGSVKSMIGHLLTAAGAAGLIKTLLALHHRTLPPSLNFDRPADARLDGSGSFRVQTHPAPWDRRPETSLRRAAVSAFGFGGINAHLLLEEWKPAAPPPSLPRIGPESKPVAIVGLAARIGSNQDLAAVDPVLTPLPRERWGGLDRMADQIFPQRPQGAFISTLDFPAGRFRIPPSEIPDLSAQQLLMLQVGAAALNDAGLDLRQQRPRAGAVIGMEFDPPATDFYLRWRWTHTDAHFGAAFARQDQTGPAQGSGAWRRQLAEAVSPPLTPTRTLGNLGGIVASRLAREFGLGGPSFGVSAQTLGGLQALEIAVRFLQQGEVDLMLTGAVELTGDLRNLVANYVLNPSEAALAEGAAALVLKRLEDARRDGDRIYGVVEGLGAGLGPGCGPNAADPGVLARTAEAALGEARKTPGEIDRLEPLGGGAGGREDGLETLFGTHGTPPPAIPGRVRPFAGCVTGLMAVLAALPHSKESRPATPEAQPPFTTALVGGACPDGFCVYAVLCAGGPGSQGAQPSKRHEPPPLGVPVCRRLRIPPLATAPPGPLPDIPITGKPAAGLEAALERLVAGSAAVTRAHEVYLDLSFQLRRQYCAALGHQARLESASTRGPAAQTPAPQAPAPAFDRRQCLEFARGLAANVLGPAFAEVDTFAVRVRLPDEPLMLVDRILSVEGEPLSLGAGRVLTEHEVHPQAWYLDGGRAPDRKSVV